MCAPSCIKGEVTGPGAAHRVATTTALHRQWLWGEAVSGWKLQRVHPDYSIGALACSWACWDGGGRLHVVLQQAGCAQTRTVCPSCTVHVNNLSR